jgi:DNA polymerase
MDSDRLRYLEALGIQAWTLRRPVSTATAAVEEDTPLEPAGRPDGVAGLDWEALGKAVENCTACALHRSRTQTVFGVGNRSAEWLFIGEAPGAEEDRRGEPFVGRAGQLLNAMLRAIGLEREQVYITNILKSRPPKNRDPRPEEVAACTPFLRRQIALIKPRIIVALGRIAAQHLLNTDASLGRLRGRTHIYEDTRIPVVATYHPAYLLRNPAGKAKAWQDLCFARRVISEPSRNTNGEIR